MIYFKFMLAILTIVSIGYCVFGILFRGLKELDFFEQIIISFGLGAGFISLEMFFLSLMGIKFSVLNIFVFQIPVYFLFFKFYQKNIEVFNPSEAKSLKNNPLNILFVLLITFNIGYILLNSSSLPFTSFTTWDSWCNYGYKAKIFFFDQRINPAVFKDAGMNIPHPDYPLMMPLLETYLSLFLGKINEPLIKLLLSLYYIGLAGSFYYILAKEFPRTFALGLTFCLSSLPVILEWSPTGYIDIPLAFYTTAGILYLWSFLKEEKNNKIDLLLLAGILLGLGMWVKNEGQSLWLAVILSVLFIRKLMPELKAAFSYKHLITLIVIPFIMILPWFIFRQYYGITPYYFKGPFQDLLNLALQRLPGIVILSIKEFMSVSDWNLLWYIFIIYCFFYIFKRKKDLSLFFISIIVLQFLSYVFIYIIWPVPHGELILYIRHSIDRLLILLAPLALFFISQQIKEDL